MQTRYFYLTAVLSGVKTAFRCTPTLIILGMSQNVHLHFSSALGIWTRCNRTSMLRGSWIKGVGSMGITDPGSCHWLNHQQLVISDQGPNSSTFLGLVETKIWVQKVLVGEKYGYQRFKLKTVFLVPPTPYIHSHKDSRTLRKAEHFFWSQWIMGLVVIIW